MTDGLSHTHTHTHTASLCESTRRTRAAFRTALETRQLHIHTQQSADRTEGETHTTQRMSTKAKDPNESGRGRGPLGPLVTPCLSLSLSLTHTHTHTHLPGKEQRLYYE